MSAENWRFWKKTWLHVRPLAKQCSLEALMALWSQSVMQACAEESSSSSTASFATILTRTSSSINPLFNHRISNARRPWLKQTTFYKESFEITIAVFFSETTTICLRADINPRWLLMRRSKSFISPLYVRSQMKFAFSILFFFLLFSLVCKNDMHYYCCSLVFFKWGGTNAAEFEHRPNINAMVVIKKECLKDLHTCWIRSTLECWALLLILVQYHQTKAQSSRTNLYL